MHQVMVIGYDDLHFPRICQLKPHSSHRKESTRGAGWRDSNYLPPSSVFSSLCRMQFSHMDNSRSMFLLLSSDLVFSPASNRSQKDTFVLVAHNDMYAGCASSSAIMCLYVFLWWKFQMSVWAMVGCPCKWVMRSWYCGKAVADMGVWNICWGCSIAFACNIVISLWMTYDNSSGYISACILLSHRSNHSCVVLPFSTVTTDDFLRACSFRR